MYTCIYVYVYPSHSTRNTLIALFWQFVEAKHGNWDVHLPSLATDLLAISLNNCTLRSALPFTQSRAKRLLTRPPFWLRSSCTLRGPDPWPCPPREAHNIRAVHVRNYVGVDWTAGTLVLQATNTFKIVTQEFPAPSHVAHTCKTDTE